MADYTTLKSPYRRGANYGAPLGLYLSAALCAVSSCIYAGAVWQYVSMFGEAMIVAVPILLFLQLRRGIIQGQSSGSFEELLTEGMATFVCAAVVAVSIGYIYMRFLNPQFLMDFFSWTVDNINELGATASDPAVAAQYNEYGRIFNTMLESGQMPRVIDFQLSALWLICFPGWLLSLVIAAIMRRRRKEVSNSAA